ncbi:uncharacterized protein WM277_000169 [Molossus nigricans]
MPLPGRAHGLDSRTGPACTKARPEVGGRPKSVSKGTPGATRPANDLGRASRMAAGALPAETRFVSTFPAADLGSAPQWITRRALQRALERARPEKTRRWLRVQGNHCGCAGGLNTRTSCSAAWWKESGHTGRKRRRRRENVTDVISRRRGRQPRDLLPPAALCVSLLLPSVEDGSFICMPRLLWW